MQIHFQHHCQGRYSAYGQGHSQGQIITLATLSFITQLQTIMCHVSPLFLTSLVYRADLLLFILDFCKQVLIKLLSPTNKWKTRAVQKRDSNLYSVTRLKPFTTLRTKQKEKLIFWNFQKFKLLLRSFIYFFHPAKYFHLFQCIKILDKQFVSAIMGILCYWLSTMPPHETAPDI